jgi:hypothetical protein
MAKLKYPKKDFVSILAQTFLFWGLFCASEHILRMNIVHNVTIFAEKLDGGF